jgi:hypothetical protein
MRVRFALSAVALALGFAAAPASAHPAGPHFHHFGHWGHWGGPGFVAVGVYGDPCLRWRPIYDADGVYLGRRPVNICY